MAYDTDTARLVRRILPGYALPVFGIHGLAHWARVLENGLRLAASTGADQRVVTLFALFHDARRINDDRDDGHGRRGAEFARSIESELGLEDRALLELLYDACNRHTDGLVLADVTVQTCWDADRLDLARVGITPRANRLCTPAARELIPWASSRAVADYRPAILKNWDFQREGQLPTD